MVVEETSNASSEVSSRWWYGVAVMPLLVFISYVLIFVIRGTREAIPSSDVALIANVSSAFTLLFVFFLNILLVLVFAVSLLMDIRTIRKSRSEWTPSWGYVGVGLLHLLNLVFPLLWVVVTAPGAVVYLYQRHKYIGAP